MIIKSDRCDICGDEILCDRVNGWEGHFKIEGLNNSSHISNNLKVSTACHDCGYKIVRYIESIKKEFVVKMVVTYTGDNKEKVNE